MSRPPAFPAERKLNGPQLHQTAGAPITNWYQNQDKLPLTPPVPCSPKTARILGRPDLISEPHALKQPQVSLTIDFRPSLIGLNGGRREGSCLAGTR